MVELASLNDDVSLDDITGRIINLTAHCSSYAKHLFFWWSLGGQPPCSPEIMVRRKEFITPCFNRFYKPESQWSLDSAIEWDRAVFDQVCILTGRNSKELTCILGLWLERAPHNPQPYTLNPKIINSLSSSSFYRRTTQIDGTTLA